SCLPGALRLTNHGVYAPAAAYSSVLPHRIPFPVYRPPAAPSPSSGHPPAAPDLPPSASLPGPAAASVVADRSQRASPSSLHCPLSSDVLSRLGPPSSPRSAPPASLSGRAAALRRRPATLWSGHPHCLCRWPTASSAACSEGYRSGSSPDRWLR